MKKGIYVSMCAFYSKCRRPEVASFIISFKMFSSSHSSQVQFKLILIEFLISLLILNCQVPLWKDTLVSKNCAILKIADLTKCL